MHAPQPEHQPVDPDYDDLWQLVGLLSCGLDHAKAEGYRCDVPIPKRLVDVLAAVDACPVPAS